jgi:hypothetical protein
MSARTRLLVLVGLWALLPGPAMASTEYPTEIQTQLQLSYTPPCSYCHAGNDTDAGTATTPLAVDMENFGLQGDNNLPSLDGAIAGMEGSKDIYITYLQDDVDPNNPSSSAIPGITYGCFNVTGQGRLAGTPAFLLVGLALLFLVLPRRRPPG